MAPTRPTKVSRKRKTKSLQPRQWTSDELQGIIDAVARGDSYESMAANKTEQLQGKPLRSAVELRQVLQPDGAAHDAFWDLPIYWDHSKSIEDAGEIQENQDVSPLNNIEEEELLLFHCRGMKGIDPNKFNIKRSSAFLTAQLTLLVAEPTSLAKIAGRNIVEKRALKAQLEASGVAPMTPIQDVNTFSQAAQAHNSDEIEDEGDGDIMDIDGNGSYARAPVTETTVGHIPSTRELDTLDKEPLRESRSQAPPTGVTLDGGAGLEDRSGAQGDESSDDEIDDPPHIVTPRPPAPDYASRLDNQIKDFCRRWIQRPASGLDAAKEDRCFIKHARRWGMSAAKISKTGLLTTGRMDPAGVAHRIRSMLHDGKDVDPRTEGFTWKRYKASQKTPSTPREWEVRNLKEAIANGKTAREIKQSGIITEGKNTLTAIKHRWETYNWHGAKFPTPK
ncbi:MAG: hypothetical protein Q9212_001610 [Teloschistes hypoglaucus]